MCESHDDGTNFPTMLFLLLSHITWRFGIMKLVLWSQVVRDPRFESLCGKFDAEG